MHNRKPKPYISRSPSMKLILRKNAKQPSFLSGKKGIEPRLENVFGFTACSNSAFSYCTNNGLLIYPSGSVIILHDFNANKNDYLVTNNKTTVTSCSLSPDGKYLVTGECGHQPAIRVWDVKEKAELVRFYSHKYEVACVAFSCDMRYVISIGSDHDMAVNLWDWKNKFKTASNKISTKVKALTISQDSTFFVTAGVKHVKFWSLPSPPKLEFYKSEPLPLTGRSAILGNLRNETFSDAQCGYGKNNNKVYIITQKGVLSMFSGPPSRKLETTVEFHAESGNCLAVSETAVICGGAQGRVCLYSANDLVLISILPTPIPLDGDKLLKDKNLEMPALNGLENNGPAFADCITCALDANQKFAFCLYSDHSFYTWNLKDVFNIDLLESKFFHSSCIWGIVMGTVSAQGLCCNGKQTLPLVITCSSDGTVRFWIQDYEDEDETCNDANALSHGLHLKHILYTDKYNGGLQTYYSPTPSSKEKADVINRHYFGIRSMALSKDGRYIACGDRIGNLRIYEMSTFKEVAIIEAHDGEILSLDFSYPLSGDKKPGEYYLASSSRDRLIHVYGPGSRFSQCQTLSDHSAPVCTIRFSLIRSSTSTMTESSSGSVMSSSDLKEPALLLVSCAADKSIIIREAIMNRDDKGDTQNSSFNIEFVLLHQISNTAFCLYDMDIDIYGRSIVTACQDRNIRIYDVLQGKQKYVCKGSLSEEGILVKAVFDPSGTFVATSSSDKAVHIIEFGVGEIVASFCGHSEVVTDLKFSADCRRLITTTCEGSIFTWKISSELTKRMIAKLPQNHPENKHLVAKGEYSTFINSSILSTGDFITKEYLRKPYNQDPLYEALRVVTSDINDEKMADFIGVKEELTQASYKFSIGQLPSWAQKQVTAIGKLNTLPEKDLSINQGVTTANQLKFGQDIQSPNENLPSATTSTEIFRTIADNESPQDLMPSDVTSFVSLVPKAKFPKTLRWGLKRLDEGFAITDRNERKNGPGFLNSLSLIDINSSFYMEQTHMNDSTESSDMSSQHSDHRNCKCLFPTPRPLYSSREHPAKSVTDVRIPIAHDHLVAEYDASSSDDKESLASSNSVQHSEPVGFRNLFSEDGAALDDITFTEDRKIPTSDFLLSLSTNDTHHISDPLRNSISQKYLAKTFDDKNDTPSSFLSSPLKQTVQEMDAARKKMKNVLQSLKLDPMSENSFSFSLSSKYKSISMSHASIFPAFEKGFDFVTRNENSLSRVKQWHRDYNHNRSNMLYKGQNSDMLSIINAPTINTLVSQHGKSDSMTRIKQLSGPNTFFQGRKPLSYISPGRRPTIMSEQIISPKGLVDRRSTTGLAVHNQERMTLHGADNDAGSSGIIKKAGLTDDNQINEWRSMTSLLSRPSKNNSFGRGILSRPSLYQASGGYERHDNVERSFSKPRGPKPIMWASHHSLNSTTPQSRYEVKMVGSAARQTLTKSPSFRDLLKEAADSESRDDIPKLFPEKQEFDGISIDDHMHFSTRPHRQSLTTSLGINNLVEFNYASFKGNNIDGKDWESGVSFGDSYRLSHSQPPSNALHSHIIINNDKSITTMPINSFSHPARQSLQNSITATCIPNTMVSGYNVVENEKVVTSSPLINLDTRTSPDGTVSSMPEVTSSYAQNSGQYYIISQSTEKQKNLGLDFNKFGENSFKNIFDQLKVSLLTLRKTINCSKIMETVEYQMAKILDEYKHHYPQSQDICLHQHIPGLAAIMARTQADVVRHFDSIIKLLNQFYLLYPPEKCSLEPHAQTSHCIISYEEAVRSLHETFKDNLEFYESLSLK